MKILPHEMPISSDEFKTRSRSVKPIVGNGEAMPKTLSALKKLGTASAKEIAQLSGVSVIRTRIRLQNLVEQGKAEEIEKRGVAGTKFFKFKGE